MRVIVNWRSDIPGAKEQRPEQRRYDPAPRLWNFVLGHREKATANERRDKFGEIPSAAVGGKAPHCCNRRKCSRTVVTPAQPATKTVDHGSALARSANGWSVSKQHSVAAQIPASKAWWSSGGSEVRRRGACREARGDSPPVEA